MSDGGGFRVASQNLRVHTPSPGDRPVVVIHGDGSAHGTSIETVGWDAPGPILGYSIAFDVNESIREGGPGLALGTFTHAVPVEGEELTFAKDAETGEYLTDTFEAWVRFGESPRELFEARTQLRAAIGRLQAAGQIEHGADPLLVEGGGCGGCPGAS